MELRFFLLADFVNVSDTKMNVIGTFNTIATTSFPMQHSSMYLVAKIAAELGEFAVDRKITILFFDEDANELGKLEGGFSFPKPQRGHVSEGDFVFNIRDTVFDKAGRYEFRLLVDDHLLGTVPLDLVQLEESSQAN